MKKFLSYSFIGAGLFIFTGCATLTSGGKQNIYLTSDTPLSGTISLADGTKKQGFTTPTTIVVDRGAGDLIISDKNNKIKTKVVKPTINPWIIGNFINFVGVFGTTTDMISGAAWKYDDAVDIETRH